MVHDQIISATMTVKETLRNIPQRIGPEIAAEVDPLKCEIIMLKEIDRTLEELSRLAERYE